MAKFLSCSCVRCVIYANLVFSNIVYSRTLSALAGRVVGVKLKYGKTGDNCVKRPILPYKSYWLWVRNGSWEIHVQSLLPTMINLSPRYLAITFFSVAQMQDKNQHKFWAIFLQLLRFRDSCTFEMKLFYRIAINKHLYMESVKRTKRCFVWKYIKYTQCRSRKTGSFLTLLLCILELSVF